MGVYEVVSSPAVDGGLSTDEFGRRVTPYDLWDSAPPTSFNRDSAMGGHGILQSADGDTHQAPWTSSLPTALIGHEWGQKGISLTGKEFARHAVHRLTEKELESCRVQMQDLVRRKKLAIEVMSYSSVSRRSSSASSARSWPSQRYYGFAQWKHRQLAPSGSSFSNVGYRLEMSPSDTIGHGTLRRNRHRHSSSMSSVPQGVGTFGYNFQQFGSVGYNKHCSVTWADQHASSPMEDSDDTDGTMRDVDDYVFV